MVALPRAPQWLRSARVPLTLLTLLTLAACDSRPGLGLVVQNPVDPERPYFHDFGTLKFGQQVERVFEIKNKAVCLGRE